MGNAVYFIWDPAKASSNFHKHGVAFEMASTAFDDPLSLTVADPKHSVGEERSVLVGVTLDGKLVVVVHVDNGDTVRIISARLATRWERKVYEEST